MYKPRFFRRMMVLSHAVAAATLMCAATDSIAQMLAFPEAEGFGANVTGGRGGSIYHVTNLNNSGSGSFRDAVSQPNRIVVFDVGGWIDLQSPVSVSSNITIAGQTAPGDGIGIRNYGISFSGADNVIARYLRVRQGPDFDSVGRDAITVEGGSNMIFDHISASWGRDEVFSIRTSPNITVQNSIIGEGLLNHSMGGLIEWNSISMHHNLFINNNDRNPKAKGVLDFVNNVVYNWGNFSFIAGDSAGVSEANLVGNYFIAGPSTTELHDPISRGNANYRLYMEGNYWDGNQNGVLDGHELQQWEIDDVLTWMPSPYAYPAIRTDSAIDAYHKVLAGVGASISRDSVDSRYIDEVINQTGQIILHPSQVGGWGPLAGGAAPTDSDQDGMPDAWELARGLNPNNPADANDLNLFGWTRIEEYINGIVGIHRARVWDQPGGNWENSADWTSGKPVYDDNAYIRGSGAGTNGHLTIDQPGARAWDVFIGGNGSPAGETLSVTGGSLNVFNTIHVGAENNARLEITGGEVSAKNVVLGSFLHSGTLDLHGGTLRTQFLAFDGAGTWSWNGGTLGLLGDMVSAVSAGIGASGGTIDTAGFNATLSGSLGGSGSLTKIGEGAAELTGTNTYTGGTILKAGVLGISSASNIGGPTSTITFDGGALRVRGNAISNLNSHAVNWSSFNGGIDVASASNTFTISQSIGGSGSFTKAGAGQLILSGTNTHTGGNRVNGGTLIISQDANLGAAGTSITLGGGAIRVLGAAIGDLARPISLSNSNTIEVNQSGHTLLLSQPISGDGSLSKSGAGTLVLGTANSFSGETRIAAGTLKLGHALALQNSTVNLTTAGTTLDLNGFSATFGGLAGSRGIDLKGTTLTIGNNGRNTDYSGSLTSSAGAASLVKIGDGVTNLSGTNAYTGGTTLRGGALGISTSANIGGTSSAIRFEGGLLRINGTTLKNLNTHTVNWSSFDGGFDVASASNTFTVSSSVSGPGRMIKQGPGVLVLSGSNSYSGGTYLRDGILSIGTSSHVGGAGSALHFEGGTLRITGNALTNLNSHTVNWSAFNGGIDVASSTNTVTINQNIGGDGAFAKTGAGTVVLNAVNTFTGDTVVSAGSLRLGNALALQNSTLVPNGGNIDFPTLNSATFGGIRGSGGFDLKGKTFYVGANDQDGTYSGALTNSGAGGAFVKIGAGTLTLTGSNSFAGPYTIQEGAISVSSMPNSGSNGPLGSGSTPASLVLDGGTLRYTGGSATSNRRFTLGVGGGTIDGSGTGGLNLNSTGAVAFTGSGDRELILTGLNSDNGFAFALADGPGGKTSLRKREGGRWIIGNASLTYSGNTIIEAGTLIMNGSANVLPFGPGKGNLVIEDGARFEMNGRDLAINALFGEGNLNNRGGSTRTVTIGHANASGTFTGSLSNNGTQILNLTKIGAGTQYLLGSNSYQGGATINGGALVTVNHRNGPLTINTGSMLITAKPTANNPVGTSVVPSLTIDTSDSKLDLTNNSLIIDYSGSSPAHTIRGYLRSGAETGLGIVSSAADATRRLGYTDNATRGLATFSGQQVDATSILIKFTYAGDADLDGDVDGIDVGAWAQNFTGDLGGAGSKHWYEGDWDYDGDVDGVDVGLWAQAFTGELGGGGLAPLIIDSAVSPEAIRILQGLGIAVVPEPALLALGACGLFALCRPKRRPR